MSNLYSVPISDNFNATELEELRLKFEDSLVRKYLTMLSAKAVVSLAVGDRSDNESAESFLEKRARVQGSMMAIETLLSMKPASES